MKIYLISDAFTQQSLLLENISVKENWFFLRKNKSIIFVESAWRGYQDRWKYKIASYPDYPERTNKELVCLVEKAKKKGIPTVFWNKEDGIHFDRFIDSAKHFDHIFTVDANCVERYRAIVPSTTTVDVAMFPVQPRIHYFKGFDFKKFEANFVGSYSRHDYSLRQSRQDMLFKAAQQVGLPVTVFDRNSNHKSSNYRYPVDDYNLTALPAVSYKETSDIYRQYLVSLNVNTIEDSPTMFSRRVAEVLACGGVLVSTPCLAIDQYFSEFCYVVKDLDQAIELFAKLKHGPSRFDLDRARAGSDYILQNLTWEKFLKRVFEVAWG